MIIFSGYSDDVVCVASQTEKEEYYSAHYLLSEGTRVTAQHTTHGWQMTCSDPDHIMIPAVDCSDEDLPHADPRIPAWAQPEGYSPCLIIPRECHVIAWRESCHEPFTEEDSSPQILPYHRLWRELNESVGDESMDGIDIEDLQLICQIAEFAPINNAE